MFKSIAMQRAKNTGIVIIFLLLLFIASKPAEAIKIGLKTGLPQCAIAASTNATLIDESKSKTLTNVSGMKVLRIKPGSSGIIAYFDNKPVNLHTNYIRLKPLSQGFVYGKNRWYRGSMLVYSVGGSLTVINDLSLEEYLLGVVPSEMPSRWNIEAHKAQAIAARSYAIANLGKRRKYGYDLKDTPEDQAYGGASSETSKTNLAVMQTSGQVLVYGTKVIPAYYFASAGGYTLNSGDVWIKDLPYIHSVPSFDGGHKKNGHGIGMSQYGANTLANYGYNAYQILGYFYKNVKLYKVNAKI